MYLQSDDMSEFGTGYAYCLGLFLAHEMRLMDYQRKAKDGGNIFNASMWLYGAADHLFELTAPPSLPLEKREEVENFKDYVLSNRLSDSLTFEQAAGMNDTAKRLLLEWDLFNGIPAEKGDWE